MVVKMESDSRIMYLDDHTSISTNDRLRLGISLFDSFETISSRWMHPQESVDSSFKSFEQNNQAPGREEYRSILDGMYERLPIGYLELRSESYAVQRAYDFEGIPDIQVESLPKSTSCCFECALL